MNMLDIIEVRNMDNEINKSCGKVVVREQEQNVTHNVSV